MGEIEKHTVQKYEKLLAGISEASMMLLNGSDFGSSVSKALKILGEATHTDRTYLFKVYNKNNVEVIHYSYEWTTTGIEPQINNLELQEVKVSDVDDSLNVLKSGRVFKAHTDKLPQNSKTGGYLKIQNIKSVLMVPVFLHQQLWGFVGYDSCKSTRDWSSGEENMLKTFSASVAKAQENFTSKAKLKATNKLLRLVTENAKDIIALIGGKGEYKYLSPSIEDVLGYKPQEIVSLTGDVLFEDDTAGVVIGKLRESANGFPGHTPSETFIHKAGHKEGRTVYLETKVTVVKAGNEESNHLQIISRDVTDKVLLEKDKEENRRKERELINLRSLFVSMASHQFRTPLAVIQSNLDLISVTLKRFGFPHETQEVLDQAVSRVKGQIGNMTDLMTDMLLLGEFQERGLKVNRKEFSVKLLIDEVIKEVKVADFGNHKFHSSGNDQQVFADRTLIKHTIVNLVENACKYSADGSDIHLIYGSDQNGENTFVEVQDSGIGIHENDLNSVTSTFFRGKNTGDIKGTGLGLAIVNEFVGAHGGTLKVDSELNKGTVVRIELPQIKNPNAKFTPGFEAAQ